MYLTAQQFSKKVGLPYHFVLRLCQEKKLPFLKNGMKKMIPINDGLGTLQRLAFDEMEPNQNDPPVQHFDFRKALKSEKDSYRSKR